jgi:F-type H+-transporting ATPase subunit delta
MLIKRGHDPEMNVIHDIFVEKWNAVRRVLPVTVQSAIPLSGNQATALSQVLAKRTGASIQIHQSVEPNLIAGLVVTIGDRVIDASARTTLEQLQTAMSGE